VRVFFAGIPKIVQVHTTTNSRHLLGRRQPAIASPGDQSSCELQQFLEAQRKKILPKNVPAEIVVRKKRNIP